MTAMQFLLYMGWPAIICLVVGLGLVIYEMFTPGFAVPGITGLILLIASVVLTASSLSEALIMILGILIVLSLVFVIALRSAVSGKLSRSPLVNRIRPTKEEGYLSTRDMNYFVGHQGVATTVLRPAGTADFEGVKLDVVTEGEFIDKGARLQVVRVEGRRIVVRSQA
jgi:membrane-bound ClpP family serine protease